MPALQLLPDSLPRPAFTCSSSGGGAEAAWVRVAGQLDMATVPQLERTLSETRLEARLTVLDLRDLAFMDCSGLHAVVDASTRARQAGCRLLVLRGAPSVDRLFTLTGSSERIEFGDLQLIERAL
jgi:anti-sigma B factor antagonist